MTLKRVSGVLWWKMNLSDYKAVYTRGSAGGYTKDFLQCTKDMSERVIPSLFGGEKLSAARNDYGPTTYTWPGGSFVGKVYLGTDRVEFGNWSTGAPLPWSIGDPSSDYRITLGGSTSFPPVGGGPADAQWRDVLAPQGPWLVAVQLEGRWDELHLRAYLENPPPDLVEASVTRLPPALWKTMQKGKRSGLAFAGPPIRADGLVTQIIDSLTNERN